MLLFTKVTSSLLLIVNFIVDHSKPIVMVPTSLHVTPQSALTTGKTGESLTMQIVDARYETLLLSETNSDV